MRLADNPALHAATQAGAVVPVFVLDDALWGPAGAARRHFLVSSLHALHEATDGHLVVRRGKPAEELTAVARTTGAAAVYAAADFGPYGRGRDDRTQAAAEDAGVQLRWTGSPYAVEPGSVVKGDGTPFKVFTPFSRAWAAHGWDEPTPRARSPRWADGPRGVAIPSAPPVDAELPPAGEKAARARWAAFRDGGLEGYQAGRDTPSGDHTSRLSPYLKWGCLHPRTLLADLDGRRAGHAAFRNELCWREFYADVLWHHPDSARRALQPDMGTIEIDTGSIADRRFVAWCRARTGYPIVDAGMAQLLAQGWVHNRVRMIVASFLVKDLHLDWTRGARWFMEHLVDGDLASNNHGWQWVAGTGTDAAPYFRIFNPVTQGLKFDPDGDYVRAFVPELAGVAGKAAHQPWELSDPPSGYPERIVDHKAERDEALARYQATRR